MEAPCNNCDRRTETCHDYCKEYKKFAEYRQSIRDARAKERREDVPPHDRWVKK